jgi:hypothetical protein
VNYHPVIAETAYSVFLSTKWLFVGVPVKCRKSGTPVWVAKFYFTERKQISYLERIGTVREIVKMSMQKIISKCRQ